MAERVSRHKHPNLVQFVGATVAAEHSTVMLFEVTLIAAICTRPAPHTID